MENDKQVEKIVERWFKSGKPLLQCINEIAPNVDLSALERLFLNYNSNCKEMEGTKWEKRAKRI